MRLRRWLLVIGGFTAVLVAGVLAYLFLTPVHPISEQTFRQIQPGMSQETVEQLLGGPPGDYRTRAFGFDRVEIVGMEGEQRVWKSDYGTIFVWFDAAGIVLNAEFVEPLAPPTAVHRFLEWVWPTPKEAA